MAFMMSFASFRSIRWVAVGVIVLTALSSAQALVINDPSSGSSNPPQNSLAPTTTHLTHGDPGWDHVGSVTGGTGVYLGNGWVLTANHLVAGGTTGHSINLGGTVYNQNPTPAITLHNPDNSLADLTLFQLGTLPALSSLTIRSTAPLLTQQVVMIGYGFTRGSGVVLLINNPGVFNDVYGYNWSGTHAKTWGTNTVSALTSLQAVNGANSTHDYRVAFDQAVIGDAQATTGDSGGAGFTFNTLANQWELSGIMLAIDAYSGQPDKTAAFGTHTLIADLSIYQNEILQIVPEPASLALLCLGSLTLLRRRRA